MFLPVALEDEVVRIDLQLRTFASSSSRSVTLRKRRSLSVGAESRRRMPVLFLTPHSSLASIRPRPLSKRMSGARRDCNCSAADHLSTTSRPHLSTTPPVPTTVNSKWIGTASLAENAGTDASLGGHLVSSERHTTTEKGAIRTTGRHDGRTSAGDAHDPHDFSPLTHTNASIPRCAREPAKTALKPRVDQRTVVAASKR